MTIDTELSDARAEFRRRWLVLLAILTMAAPSLLLAQEAGGEIRLTVDEAIERAMVEGRDVQLSLSAVRQAEAQVKAARSAIFPQISGTANYLRTIRTPFAVADLPEGIDLPFGQKNTWTMAVTIDQKLYAAGKVGTGLAIAKELVDQVGQQSEQSKQDVSLEVAVAYYDAVLAGAVADIARATTRLTDQQLEHARLLRKAGNASDLDVLRVEVERQNLQPLIVAAENTRDIAILNLLRLINLPPSTQLTLVDDLGAPGFAPAAATAISEATENGVERRPAVIAAERVVRIRQQQVRLQKAEYLPTVDLKATFGGQALPGTVFPSGGDFRDDWSGGLSVKVPIWNGGRRAADVASAHEDLKQAELQLAQLRAHVQLEIEQLRREVGRTEELIRARAETVAQAQRVYELTQLAFRQGVIDTLRVTDARTQLRQSRGDQVQAIHDYYVALARLLRAAGSPNINPATFADASTGGNS